MPEVRFFRQGVVRSHSLCIAVALELTSSIDILSRSSMWLVDSGLLLQYAEIDDQSVAKVCDSLI